MARSLEGLLVVAVEQAVAAPLCTGRLADAGARVIKIERKEGDLARGYDDVALGHSSYFVWLNRGKESIMLDFKSPEDAAILSNMLDQADVFIQNLSPGAAARAGLDSEMLRRTRPRLITCDISGYGDSGPARDRKAYDFLIQCETGLASITGGENEAGRVGVSVADICCGMNAHAGILQALYERERTGRGGGFSVSLFDGIAEWLAVPLLFHDYGQKAPDRHGLRHASIAPYGVYRAGGNAQIAVAVQTGRQWARFCTDVLKMPELADDPRFTTNILRVRNREAMDGLIDGVIGDMPMTEVVDRLTNADLPWAPFNSIAELSTHPHLRRIRIDTSTGPVDVPAPPLRWTGVPEFAPGPLPDLNGNGAALRNEFAPVGVK